MAAPAAAPAPDHNKSIAAVATAFTELEALREYANQSFRGVARVFGGSVKLLGVAFALGATVEKVPGAVAGRPDRNSGFVRVTFTTHACAKAARAEAALAAAKAEKDGAGSETRKLA